MPRVLITGAAGFVGAAAVRAFAAARWEVRAAARLGSRAPGGGVEWRAVGDITAPRAWDGVASDVDCVVHAAARVHIRRDTAADSLAAHRAVNVEATRRLALEAARRGVKRFVFVSTIGVNGARTVKRPFTESDPPGTHNPYTVSKLEAEEALRAISKESGIEVAILRPPLVYGAGAPGNFNLLAQWIGRGRPLPLGRVTNNRRSLVYLGNLADALVRCASHPRAANRVFLVADEEVISTAGLVAAMARAMHRELHLWNVPLPLLEIAGFASGAVRQLLGSLEVDTTRIRRELEWTPPFTLEQGLARTFQEARV